MKKVQNMLKLKPETEKINLSLLQIETINDLIFELFHFPNLKEIDLSCNRIKSLPKDLSILSTVERLDLSNNLFLDLEQVLFALNTMPKLKELNISYDPSELKHTLGFYLPKLEVINGSVIKSGGEPTLANPVVVVQNGKLQMNKAKSSQKLINHGYLFYDEELTILRALQNTVNQIVEEQQGNPAYQSMSFVRNLNNFNQSIRKSFDYNKTITEKCYDGEYSTNADTLKPKVQYLKEIVRLYDQVMRELNTKMADSAKSIIDILFIMIETIEKQADFLNKKIFGNHASTNMFSKRSLAYRGSMANVDDEGNEIPFTNAERVLLKLKVTELENEVNELRKENKHVYQTLVNQNRQMLQDFAKKTKQVFKLNTTAQDNLNNTKRLDKINLKGYSMNQTIQLIADIMKSKKEYDERPGAHKQPQETLENFLYVFFSQKYGLKDMVKVEVTTMIDRIKEFTGQSQEVEAFKKILKNEIDEKFYWYLQNLRKDLRSRIETHYKTKVKRKASLVETQKYTDNKCNNGITLQDGKNILELSYKDRELKKVKAKFQIFFDENSEVNDKSNILDYNQFVEFIFAHELEKHERHLKLVSEFYNKIDQNHDGVITRKQFLTLMEIFVQREIECDLEEVLKEADPDNHNSITFSKIIEVLSSNHADRDEKMNLIECLNSIQIIQSIIWVIFVVKLIQDLQKIPLNNKNFHLKRKYIIKLSYLILKLIVIIEKQFNLKIMSNYVIVKHYRLRCKIENNYRYIIQKKKDYYKKKQINFKV